ncbi:MAG TPA: cupredoxin domain-containing protein [Candidatus Binataceae bacterium]
MSVLLRRFKALLSEPLVSKALLSEARVSKALNSERLHSEALLSEPVVSKPLLFEPLLSRPLAFRSFLAGNFAIAALAFAVPGHAQSDAGEIRFANHQYAPQTLTVPAGQPLVLKVVNSSDETIEFESFKLNREKAISPGQTITVRLPALSPGNYDFYDDFHQDVPEGSIVAK